MTMRVNSYLRQLAFSCRGRNARQLAEALADGQPRSLRELAGDIGRSVRYCRSLVEENPLVFTMTFCRRFVGMSMVRLRDGSACAVPPNQIGA